MAPNKCLLGATARHLPRTTFLTPKIEVTSRLFENLWTPDTVCIYHVEFDGIQSRRLASVTIEGNDTIKLTGGVRNSSPKI
jgi:hypothetical protein